MPKTPNIHLLSWIWHLCAEQTQGLKALPDRMNVCHSHEHYFTVWIILCREIPRKREETENCTQLNFQKKLFHKNKPLVRWTDEMICLQIFCKEKLALGLQQVFQALQQNMQNRKQQNVSVFVFSVLLHITKSRAQTYGKSDIAVLGVTECSSRD